MTPKTYPVSRSTDYSYILLMAIRKSTECALKFEVETKTHNGLRHVEEEYHFTQITVLVLPRFVQRLICQDPSNPSVKHVN